MIISIGDVVETASGGRGRWVSEFQVIQGYAVRPCLERLTAESDSEKATVYHQKCKDEVHKGTLMAPALPRKRWRRTVNFKKKKNLS